MFFATSVTKKLDHNRCPRQQQEGMQWIRQRGGGSNIKFIIFVLQSGYFHNRIKIEKNANYIV